MLSLPRTRSLRIAEHTVHRCDPSDGDTEYVISTLKDFLLRVELCEHGVRVETHEPMPLNLSLVYESGKDVEQIGDVPLMTGADGLLDQGVAAFKLKVSALSSLRQQQRFRISIRVAGGEDAGLQVLTQPFRTLTKLYRAPARPAPAPPASQSEPARPFTPDLLDDAERPVKRQPTEAEMQRLRGECDEIRNSMAELKSEHEKILAELSQLKASVAVANAPGFARFADSALRLSRESSTVAPSNPISLLSPRSLE